VLVVEDDAVCRKVAKKQLTEAGFEIAACGSGEEALEMLKVDDRIGLVVLDLGLPGMQGDEVLRLMRSSPATSSLPVIVLTGSPDPELEVRLMEEGADDYLRKPLEPRRFITRVRAALRRAAA
jgi:DNA-binding response OmpR family regulator